MNEHTLRRLFPNASNSTVAINCDPPEAEMRGATKARPAWTNIEDDALIEGFRTGASIEEIAKGIGRSYNGTSCRANELGLKHPMLGKWKRPERLPEQQLLRPIDRSALASGWHKNNIHPMLGKPVPDERRQKISEANKGKIVPPERVEAGLRTKYLRYGSVAGKVARGNWKAAWREVGDKRFFARSKWEANYARFLEFQKVWGQIKEWDHEPETFWFEGIKRGVRSYLPDFRVTNLDDSVEYHEVKGWMDARSRTTIRRMAIYHPAIVLIVKDSSWFKSNSAKLRMCCQGWE